MVSLSKAVQVLKQHKSHKYRKTTTNCSNFAGICWIIIILCIYTVLFNPQLLKCFQLRTEAQPRSVRGSSVVLLALLKFKVRRQVLKARVGDLRGDSGGFSRLYSCFGSQVSNFISSYLNFAVSKPGMPNGLPPLWSVLFLTDEKSVVLWGAGVVIVSVVIVSVVKEQTLRVLNMEYLV